MRGGSEIRTFSPQSAHTRRPPTHREPPVSRPRIVLPLLAGIALMVLLWLAFHDGSVEPQAPSAPVVRPAH